MKIGSYGRCISLAGIRVLTFTFGTLFATSASLSGQTPTPTATPPLTFTQSTTYDVLALPQSMAIADLDGDGFPDIIVGTQLGLSVLMNKGDGTFVEPPAVYSLPIGGGGVIAADFNGDGFPDVAFPGNGGFGVMLNRGDGTFGPAIFFPSSDGLFNVSIAAGDFTHTGRNDVALIDVGFFGCCSTLTVFRNLGNGTFVRAQQLSLSGGAAFVTTADLNKDGFIDLVTGNGNGGLTFSVLMNNKDGTFAPPLDYPVPQFRKAFPVDLNHDGNTDLVLVQSEQVRLGVSLNRGDGTFLPALITPFFPLGGITDLAVGDLDGDGNVDLATLQEPRLFFSAGSGNGTFHDPGVFLPPAPGQDGDATPIAIADLDNNGALDIITAASPRGVATAVHVRLNSRLPIAPPQIRLSIDHGGNAGSVTITITGQAFAAGTTAKLVCPGQPDLPAISNSIGTDGSLTARFNLTGATPGTCSVIIVRPDGSTATAPKRFNIEQGGAADVWVDIVGFAKIRAGRQQTYYVVLGNKGNTDSGGEVFTVAVPKPIQMEFFSNEPVIDLTSSSETTVVSFVVPGISAGQSAVFPIELTATDDPAFAHTLFKIRVQHESLNDISSLLPTAVNTTLASTLQFSPTPALLTAVSSSTNPGQPILLFVPDIYDGCHPALRASRCTQCDNQWNAIVAAENVATQAAEFYELSKSQLIARAALDKLIDLIKSSLPKLLSDPLDNLATFFDTDPHAKAIYSQLQTDKANLNADNAALCAAVSAYIQCVNNSCGGAQTTSRVPAGDDAHLDGEIITSGDPNEKVGARGVGLLSYVSIATPLRYGVLFSNKETATAPAQDVTVTDQLDVTSDDLKSFSLGPIGFGDQLVTPPAGVRSFSSTVDLRPANNLLVKVDASLNLSSGLLAWHFTSLDPATNQPPLDPTAGFLPPGGEGSVFFTVMPKSGLATNTQIHNQATIVFDVNAPIPTQTWLNTIDNDKPSSHVLALPTQSPAAIPLQWSGTDVGAGVQDFTIFVSDNNGPFTPFLTNTLSTSATFLGQAGHTYAFFSTARDLVGNLEDLKTAAEATTTVLADAIPPTTVVTLAPAPNANRWNNSNVSISLSSTDNLGGSGVQQITFSATGAQAIANANVAGNSASALISTEGITNFSFFSTDLAGNVEAAHTLTVKLDKTPPSINGARTPLANANEWNNTDVNVSFACTDALSGLAPGSPPAATLVSSEGVNQQVVGVCQDLAGNTASATVSRINIDKTPPVISGMPATGCTLWPPNHQLVQVGVISSTDALSGVASFDVTVTSSQPTDPDEPAIVITGSGLQPRTVQLRADRRGPGNMRTYTLTATTTDLAGNSTSSNATCTVPHDQGQ